MKPDVWIDSGRVFIDMEPVAGSSESQHAPGVFELTREEAQHLAERLAIHVGILHAKEHAMKAAGTLIRQLTGRKGGRKKR